MRRRTPMFDQWFAAPAPQRTPDGWVYAVEAREYGPFPSAEVAAAHRMGLFRRWNTRARARGGWAWKQTADRWVVTLPVGEPMVGRAMSLAPCSVAS